MYYKIADLNIKLDNMSKYFEKKAYKYLTNEKTEDIIVNISQEDVKTESKNCQKNMPFEYIQSTCALRALAEKLPYYNGLLLHSAIININECGIAFTALSGTGKTTHMLLWQKAFGDKVKIVNGDKPFIRFLDDIPYAYGNPWNGKENLGCNIKTNLKHICIINRSKENSIIPLTSSEAIDAFMNQVYIPHSASSISKTLCLVDDLLQYCKIWQINCNTDIEAAYVAYNTIFKTEK